MSKKRGVLLASFLTTGDEQKILEEVEYIVNSIDITNNLIFLLESADDPDKKIFTYNAIVESGKPFNPRLFTMRMHRKKHTNTLYTINALNMAVASQHNGETGKHLKLDWSEYENCVLLTSGQELRTTPVTVSKIFKIEEGPAPEEE